MSRNIQRLLIILVCAFALIAQPAVVGASTSQSIFKDNFNYKLGPVLGQGGWVSYKNGNAYSVQSNQVFASKKALFISTDDDSVITKFGSKVSDGTQVIYARTQNRNEWGTYPDGNVQVRISKGSWSSGTDVFAAVSLKADGNVAYWDPASHSYQNFALYNDNQWIRVTMQWRSSDKTARYRIDKQPWTSWHRFNGADRFVDFDNIGMDTIRLGTGGAYFDNFL